MFESLRGRRVVVVGGLGFLGSSVAHRLVGIGADVILLDALVPESGANPFNVDGIEQQLSIRRADIRDPDTSRSVVHGTDVLLSLAGTPAHLASMLDPLHDLQMNCAAQLSLLEACRQVNPNIRIVHASTRQVYGKPVYLPVDEAHPVHPVDINGIHMLAAEGYHEIYGRVYGLRTTVLRLTNTYGPRMRVRDARQTFLGVWIRNLLLNQPLQVFGDGTQLRDFSYVDDAVDAILRAATSERAVGQVVNLGGPPPVTLKELAEMLVRLHGSGRYELVPFPPDRLRIDIGDYYADCSKAAEVLGWHPTVSLEDGLRNTLDYFRTYGWHYWN